MVNTIVAIRGLFDKCELSPYDLDELDYEEDPEIISQMNAAKSELESADLSSEMIDQILRHPKIQGYIRGKIIEAIDFITSSDFQSDDESAFKY